VNEYRRLEVKENQMSAKDNFDAASKAVTEQGKKNVGPSDANYQILWQQLYSQGKAHTTENYIDAMLKTSGLSEHPAAYELQQAHHAQAVKDFNREMQNPLRIDEVKEMARSERAEKVAEAKAEEDQAKLYQMKALAEREVTSGKPRLPATYGKYDPLDARALKLMAREDFQTYRYLTSAYGAHQVSARMNGLN
jgi:hypothetical protein